MLAIHGRRSGHHDSERGISTHLGRGVLIARHLDTSAHNSAATDLIKHDTGQREACE